MTAIVDPALYGLFLVTSALLIITPGPIVSLIIAETLQHGARFGLAVALGAATMAMLYLGLYLAGFAFLLEQIPLALDVIRYAGAAYLIYLAVRAFQSTPPARIGEDDLPTERSALTAYGRSLWIALTNPKVVIFFAAFFPQFLSDSRPVEPQLALLTVSFLVISVSIDCLWVAAAARLRRVFARGNTMRAAGRLSAGVLGLGALVLLFLNP